MRYVGCLISGLLIGGALFYIVYTVHQIASGAPW